MGRPINPNVVVGVSSSVLSALLVAPWSVILRVGEERAPFTIARACSDGQTKPMLHYYGGNGFYYLKIDSLFSINEEGTAIFQSKPTN